MSAGFFSLEACEHCGFHNWVTVGGAYTCFWDGLSKEQQVFLQSAGMDPDNWCGYRAAELEKDRNEEDEFGNRLELPKPIPIQVDLL